MSLNWHIQTRATVIRAGDTTTLVSLDDWYGGKILAPVNTLLLQEVTGMPREKLAGTPLWVKARLTASCAEDLDLIQWQPCDDIGRPQAA